MLDAFCYRRSTGSAAADATDDNAALHMGRHTDPGVLTLKRVSDVPGLQLYDRARQRWLAVEELYDGDHVLVFAAEQLEQAAREDGATIIASPHRVVEAMGQGERHALVYELRALESAAHPPAPRPEPREPTPSASPKPEPSPTQASPLPLPPAPAIAAVAAGDGVEGIVDARSFGELLVALDQAQGAGDAHALTTLLHALMAAADNAPKAWQRPFDKDEFCSAQLLCRCPADFVKRLMRRSASSTQMSRAIGELAARLTGGILEPPEPQATSHAVCGAGRAPFSLELVEAEYHLGGTGRFAYPAADVLAQMLADSAGVAGVSLEGTPVLELGCGIGLAGLAAAQCGAQVLFTDRNELVLERAAANAELNGLGERVRTARVDWSDFETAEKAAAACTAAGIGVDGGCVPRLIFGAEVCFRPEHADQIVCALAELLSRASAGAEALLVIGWPNQGLERLERLLGAEELLQRCGRSKSTRSAPDPRD